ncbi:MAG: creatininase family protein [Ramlibacter sp.]|nr:creatininase family protein [Ramlibacter sp.]
MATRPRFWADLTTRDFAALDPAATGAVLPVAATEQHGPHLPLSVDQVLVDGVVQACLTRLDAALPVLFLPTQQVGYSPEHSRFPGTLTLSSATLASIWIELGQCVARSGLKKLLLLNSHGGQVSVMDIVARELRTRCDLIVYSCSWWNLPLGASTTGLFSAAEHRFGVHGGEIETSMMLALRPELVKMPLAQDFKSSSELRAATYPILGNGSSAKLGWQMQDYNPAGAAGNAAAATADKGRAVLAAAGQQLAALLAELSRLPLSTLVDRPEA